MVHEEFQQMLTAHALSALDGAEQSAVEEHLAVCQICREELNLWHETVAALAFAGSSDEPSPRVRENILARVRADQRAMGNEGAQASPGAGSKVVRLEPRRPGNLWASIGSLGAIAAAVAVLALVISVLILWRENKSKQIEIARLTGEINSSKQRLEQEREIVALLNRPGSRLTELAGTKVAAGAHATIAYDKTGSAVLLARGLPAAPAGKAYQLWFIVGNQKLPGRVFKTDATGEGSLKDLIPTEALANAVFAVTLEPESGVKAPTGDIFLLSGS